MKTLFVALMTLLIAGCKKSDKIVDDIPDCIKQNIEYFKNNPRTGVNEVDEYLFQGKLVYNFSQDYSNINDAGTSIINSDCTSLCFLGGIAGITTCNGDKFSQKAVLQRVIWKR